MGGHKTFTKGTFQVNGMVRRLDFTWGIPQVQSSSHHFGHGSSPFSMTPLIYGGFRFVMTGYPLTSSSIFWTMVDFPVHKNQPFWIPPWRWKPPVMIFGSGCITLFWWWKLMLDSQDPRVKSHGLFCWDFPYIIFAKGASKMHRRTGRWDAANITVIINNREFYHETWWFLWASNHWTPGLTYKKTKCFYI